MTCPCRYVVLLALVTTIARAQTRVADSLRQQLASSTGSARVDMLNQLTFELISRDNAQALKYNKQSLALSRKLNYVKGEGAAQSYRGVYEYLSGEYSDGRSNLRKGLALSIAASDKNNQGYTLLQIGNSYLNQSILDSSLLFYDRAYVILKDSTNPVVLSKLYKNMASLYGIRADYDLQKKYLLRCLAIRELLNNQILVADALIALAGLNVREENYDAAEKNFTRIEKIIQDNPSDLGILNNWRHQKGLYLLRERKFDEAMTLFDSARAYYLRTPLLQRYVSLQLDISRVFYERGDYEISLKILYEALRVAELKKFMFDIVDIQIQLGWVNYHLGELDQSFAFADSALAFAEKNRILYRQANALTLKGVGYTQRKEYVLAKKALTRVLEIHQQLHDNAKTSEAYMNIGFLEEAQNNFTVAQQYYRKSISMAGQSKIDFVGAWATLGLSQVAFKTGQFAEAEILAGRTEQICQQISALEILTRVYDLKRDLFAARHHYEEALRFSRKADNLKDSLHRSELARRFINLQKVEEIEKRDRDIRLLTQEKQLAENTISLQKFRLRQQYIFIIAGLLGVLLVGALAFVYARSYFKIRKLSSIIGEKHTRLQDQTKLIEKQKEQLLAANEHLEDEVQLRTEELSRQNLQLEQFAFMTSHNLRASVSRLMGLTQLFSSDKSGEELNQLLIEKIKISSKELDLTLRDLASILEVRNGANDSFSVVSFSECLQKAKEILRDEFSQANPRLQVAFQEPQGYAIEPFVTSIFLHLLSNSIRFKKDNDLEISISSRKESCSIRLEYSDNGLGFDVKEAGENLFKPFKRFHHRNTGKGLGLYMIKLQVEAMNGTIEVQSQPGNGFYCHILLKAIGKDDFEVLTRKKSIAEKSISS